MADEKQKPVFDPAILSDPPQVLPDDDFMHPTMVTVSVRLEGGETAEFSIPRSLVCGRSSYFKKAFLGGFAEAEKKAITIEAPLWVFETFVRWLYTQRLYLRSTEQKDKPVPGDSKRKRTEDGSDDSTQGDEKRARTQAGTPDEPLAIQASNSSSVRPVDTSESANVVTFYGFDLVEPSDGGPLPEEAPNNPDEEDFSNPVTWPYKWLIELYHFGDSHDTFAFRKLVFEFIQLKTQVVVPRNYLPPTKEDTKHALSRLPRSDGLFKYLAEMWARDVSIYPNCYNSTDTTNLIEEFPPQFLAACFLQAKRHAQALKCPDCKQCDDHDHVVHDRNGVFGHIECTFHEHASEADKRECIGKWARINLEWCRGKRQDDA